MVWLTGYTCRKKITITGQAGSGTNYQIKLHIGNASGGNFNLNNHSLSFPNDIRFTNSTSSTELYYWIEDVTASPIIVWIKVIDSLNSNVDIYCYYGKASDTTTSNGTNTFDFFDDFVGTVINTAKWVEVDTGSNYVTQNDQLLFGSGGGWGVAGVSTVSTIARPFVFETYIKSTNAANDFMFGIKNTGSGLSYTDYTYGIHLYNSQNIEIYEDGTSRGFQTTYIINTDYWIKIEVSATGAKYYKSTDRTTWTLFYTSVYSTASPLKIGFSPDGTGNTIIDNAKVRKYVATEPTFSLASTEEQTGSISFTSTPAGANIWLGSPLVDQGVGKLTSSIIANLVPGTYNYELRLTGYATLSGTADVTSGTQTNKVLTFAGSAYITSTPSVARIWIDTVDQGVSTPATITGLTAGSRAYSLVLTGRNNTTGNFTAIAGQTVNVPITLLTPANIGTSSMTVTPRETPCRTGICITDVSVTWINNGQSSGSHDLSITVSGGAPTITPSSYPSVSFAANETKGPYTFTVSNMIVGTHSICPNPN